MSPPQPTGFRPQRSQYFTPQPSNTSSETTAPSKSPVIPFPQIHQQPQNQQDFSGKNQQRVAENDQFQDPSLFQGLQQVDPQAAALRNPNFNAESFIASQLSNSTDVEISEFTNKLNHLRDQVAIDRKDMVYGNYKTFLAVGSQISVLSSELQTLRKLVNDLHVATTAMKQDAETTLTLNNPPANASNTNLTMKNGTLSANGSSTNLLTPKNPRLGNLANGARHNNRNSVLVLETMWAQDLSGLLRTVEGAQKYLPPIPGRHVVEESSGWDQLNAATWKPSQPVKVYLLNDYLLIAVKKNSRNGDMLSVQQTQILSADQCWPLSDIQIKDLRTIEQTPNAPPNGFVVQKDRSIYVYRHDDPKTAGNFLHAYNKLAKDLRKGNSNNNANILTAEQKARRRESMYNNTVTSDPERRGHKRSVSMDIAEKTRVLRDIDTLINDLDVKIAHRMLSEAVCIIDSNLQEISDIKEISATAMAAAQATSAASAVGGSISGKGSGHRPSTTSVNSQPLPTIDIKTLRAQILKIKLDYRSKDISDILLSNISQDYLSSGEIKSQIQLLIKLKQSDPARKTFLNSRRKLILNRIKLVVFKGDIPAFISQVVTIHFRLIRTTAEIYHACFPQSESSSTLVEWAKNEVELYIVFFARQLYNISPDSNTYRACTEVTKEQAKQLKEVGLNLDFLLEYIYAGGQDKNLAL